MVDAEFFAEALFALGRHATSKILLGAYPHADSEQATGNRPHAGTADADNDPDRNEVSNLSHHR
jgi:hypothetical protein